MRSQSRQDGFLLIGSHEVSVVMTLKITLKSWNNSRWRLAFQKQVTVTPVTHVGKHGDFI